MMNNRIVLSAVPAAEETFAGAMGISKEREQQLCELINECYIETNTYPEAVAELSARVETVNELAYSIFHIGAFAGNERAKDGMMNYLHAA